MKGEIKYINEKLLFPIIIGLAIAILTALTLRYLKIDKDGKPHDSTESTTVQEGTQSVKKERVDSNFSNKEIIQRGQKTDNEVKDDLVSSTFYEVKVLVPISLTGAEILIDDEVAEDIGSSGIRKMFLVKEKLGTHKIVIKNKEYYCEKNRLVRSNLTVVFTLESDCKTF